MSDPTLTDAAKVLNAGEADPAPDSGVEAPANTVNPSSDDRPTSPDPTDTTKTDQPWFKEACGVIPNVDLDEEEDDDAPPGVGHAVLTKSANLWPNGITLTYSFLGAKLDSKDIRQNKVSSTIPEWSKYANITFKPVDSGGNIRIAFDTKSGSWSYVGRQNTSIKPEKATMNLGWIDNLSTTLSANDRGTILHEFGHALGLLHEHQSPARGGTITLDESAVISYYMRTQGWTEKQVREQIINVFNSDDVSNYSRFDKNSVMEYFMPAQMNLQRIEIPPNNSLTALDKAYIMCNYPPDASIAANAKTLRASLTVAGVPTAKQDEIIASFSTDNTGGTARVLFNIWNEQTRAAAPKPSSGLDPSSGLNPNGDPASGLDAGPSAGAFPPPAGEPSKEPFLTVLLNKLKEFFNPGAGQMFVLQFPGRFLQQSLYAWDTKSAGIYGQFIKPTVVNESEFRLVDQMYDVAEVVSAPNGINLSIVYEQMLNNLLPKYQDNGLAKQQAKIRAWLLKDAKVSSWMLKIIQAQAAHSSGPTPAIDAPTGDGSDAPPSFGISNKAAGGSSVNRLELSNALMQEYLQAKQAWELERDAMIEKSQEFKLGTPESATALNNLTRKLAHITAVREAQLASKYADAVVQGFYHNVRQYLGYIDIKSAAEFLQDAKDSFREAALSSLDGSLKVFPVQMSPVDWFEALSTSFTVEDLTSDPDLILNAINAKSQELDVLNGQLANLLIGTKGNVDQLEKDVQEKQDLLDKQTANLASTYSSNVIAMAKTCIDAYGQVQKEQLTGKMATLKIAGAALDSLATGLQKAADAQTALTSASRALTDSLAKYALAEATDTRQQQEQIKIRVASITRELQELNARYTALNKTAAGPQKADTNVSTDDFRLFPESNNTSGGSRWQEITMYQQIKNDYSASNSRSAASASSWHVNVWFASASGSSSSSSGSSSAQAASSEQNVQIGFRATLVTVDRAGWFQPQFFKQSKAYYHINNDLQWTTYPAGVDNPEDLKAHPEAFANANKGLLPAYPVGYIICKDITIKISNASSQTSSDSDYMSKQASASGGVLCFSYSSSSQESASSKSYNFNACSNGCVIRIPGPQILGYIIQLTDKDDSLPLPDTIPDNFLVAEDDYDDATGDAGGGASHGITTGAPKTLIDKLDDILRGMGVSEETLENVHTEMKKELAALVDKA